MVRLWQAAFCVVATCGSAAERCWTSGRSFERCCLGALPANGSACFGEAQRYVQCCSRDAAIDEVCGKSARLHQPAALEDFNDEQSVDYCCGNLKVANLCWPPTSRRHQSPDDDINVEAYALCCLPLLKRLTSGKPLAWMQPLIRHDRQLLRGCADGPGGSDPVQEGPFARDSVLHEIRGSSGTAQGGEEDHHFPTIQRALQTAIHWTLKAGIRFPHVAFQVWDGELWPLYLKRVRRTCRRLLVMTRMDWATSGTMLFPDKTYLLDETRRTFSMVLRFRSLLPPFPLLEDKVWWRGSATTNWRSKNVWRTPRFILVALSKAHPEIIDARFTRVGGTVSNRTRRALEDEGYMAEWMEDMEYQLGFKYLIDVDGSSESKRLLWSLLAPGVLLKQETKVQSWVNSMLKPWVHYLPVQDNLGDIFDILRWAQGHAYECQQISQAATHLAVERLSQQSALAYLFHALKGWAEELEGQEGERLTSSPR